MRNYTIDEVRRNRRGLTAIACPFPGKHALRCLWYLTDDRDRIVKSYNGKLHKGCWKTFKRLPLIPPFSNSVKEFLVYDKAGCVIRFHGGFRCANASVLIRYFPEAMAVNSHMNLCSRLGSVEAVKIGDYSTYLVGLPFDDTSKNLWRRLVTTFPTVRNV